MESNREREKVESEREKERKWRVTEREKVERKCRWRESGEYNRNTMASQLETTS